MKLVVLSGRSGSGKTTALQALEDSGYYCIDNLPALLLPQLVTQIETSVSKHIAVSIDARNSTSNLEKFPSILEQLKKIPSLQTEIVFLDASDAELINRFSSTRRKHPLSERYSGLQQAIAQEKSLLEPLSTMADVRLDTSRMTLYELRDRIKLQVTQRREQTLFLLFESFGFKHGVPVDADFTFDVRALPNPHWIPEIRNFTGLDDAVIQFLEEADDVQAMFDDIRVFLEKWLPKLRQNNRTYVTVCLGCTGGQHRSVYLAERLSRYFKQHIDTVNVRHRELH